MTVAPPEPPSFTRQLAERRVAVLRRWIGQGEESGNNRGPFVARLMHGRVGAWCARLQWTALDVAARELGMRNPIPDVRATFAARGLLRLEASVGGYVSPTEARVGDYVCFPRPPVPWWGHAACVSLVVEPGRVKLIDGNIGRPPAPVREYDCDLTAVAIVGVARLWG